MQVALVGFDPLRSPPWDQLVWVADYSSCGEEERVLKEVDCEGEVWRGEVPLASCSQHMVLLLLLLLIHQTVPGRHLQQWSNLL